MRVIYRCHCKYGQSPPQLDFQGCVWQTACVFRGQQHNLTLEVESPAPSPGKLLDRGQCRKMVRIQLQIFEDKDPNVSDEWIDDRTHTQAISTTTS